MNKKPFVLLGTLALGSSLLLASCVQESGSSSSVAPSTTSSSEVVSESSSSPAAMGERLFKVNRNASSRAFMSSTAFDVDIASSYSGKITSREEVERETIIGTSSTETVVTTFLVNESSPFETKIDIQAQNVNTSQDPEMSLVVDGRGDATVEMNGIAMNFNEDSYWGELVLKVGMYATGGKLYLDNRDFLGETLTPIVASEAGITPGAYYTSADASFKTNFNQYWTMMGMMFFSDIEVGTTTYAEDGSSATTVVTGEEMLTLVDESGLESSEGTYSFETTTMLSSYTEDGFTFMISTGYDYASGTETSSTTMEDVKITTAIVMNYGLDNPIVFPDFSDYEEVTDLGGSAPQESM